MADAYDFWSARVPGDRLAQIEAMWARFAQSVPEIDAALEGRGTQISLPDLMGRVLGALDQLDWEIAPGEPGGPGHTLVLTAGRRHEHRVLARAVLDNAPDLPGWAFSDARPPLRDPALLAEAVAARGGGTLALGALEPGPGPHRRIDLHPSGTGDDTALARQAALAFEVLMGDEIARDWMGRRQPKRAGLLGRLGGRRGGAGTGGWADAARDRATSLIGDVKDHLPGQPFGERPYQRGSQVMYQANVLELDPAWRHDTITGYTFYKEMTQARMSGDPLSACRFSRFGEVFCGLKIGRTAEFYFDDVEQRVALAEGAHMMLAEREEGGVTGEAHGRSHVYIDLALTDLAGGMATLAELLDRIELNGPAWLIFDEAGLTDLSIPLTPRTPAKPKASYR